MAGTTIPFFKQSVNVNNAFFANSSNVVFGDIVINNAGLVVNSGSVVVGPNNVVVGNTTVKANLHYSGLNFTKDTNTAVYNSAGLVIDQDTTSEAKVNTTTLSIETGNTLFGTITSIRLGNTTSNAQITTNTLFLRDSATFLRPNSVQINTLAVMNLTHLSINAVTSATQGGNLNGSAAQLSVFNSTANGVVLAANVGGSPISTNVYVLAGNQTWRKSCVWLQHYNASTSFPFIQWPNNMFSVVDITGIIDTGALAINGFIRYWFIFNGSSRTSSLYFYNIHHVWSSDVNSNTHYVAGGDAGGNRTGGVLCHPEESTDSPFKFNLRIFNSAGQRAFARSRAVNHATNGRIRIWDGWSAYDDTVNANGVHGVQFYYGNTSVNQSFVINLVATGTPL